MISERECRRLVRGFQENLVAKKASGFYGIGTAEQTELRNRRWWPSRSSGRFNVPPCIYAERVSLALTQHPHPLTLGILTIEIGAGGGPRQLVQKEVLYKLVDLGYVAFERVSRRHEYRLLRSYKAPLYRPNDDQPPWWEVIEEPERSIVTIGIATSHGPEHWRAG